MTSMYQTEPSTLPTAKTPKTYALGVLIALVVAAAPLVIGEAGGN